jgi:hypothetical protein
MINVLVLEISLYDLMLDVVRLNKTLDCYPLLPCGLCSKKVMS